MGCVKSKNPQKIQQVATVKANPPLQVTTTTTVTKEVTPNFVTIA